MADQPNVTFADQLALDAAELEKATIKGDMTRLQEAAHEMEVLADEIDDLNAQLKVRKERYNELREEIIPTEMERLGIATTGGRGNITFANGARLSLRNDLYVNVKEEDERALHEWCRNNGLKDLIKEKIHGQTLKGVMRERMEENEPLPPMVRPFYKTYAVLTRSKT